ncbi:MAG: class I SAM-dependent methyltransferase [Rhodospirillaceae bacterium]|jgi:2-polyprenyl-3-methyl-5-hydroxy-6-metoxy-1,4-benzoquinol methylase|nr:class I SAM-dependent methyltransferase [Rhodospirillaceae bacterium]
MSTETAPSSSVGDDPRKYAFTVWNYRQGEIVAAMVHLGNELGLYQAMAGAGPVGAGALAERTGLHERWILEWLRLQAAAKLIDYRGDDRFELPDAAINLLVDMESKSFVAGEFAGPEMANTLARLYENFRTGLGNSYESAGPDGAHRGECRHWLAARNDLIPKMIPALDGVETKLQAGALVADVGCGDGAAVLAMAESYPNSRIVGIDASRHAVALVAEKAQGMGLTNVDLRHAGGEDLAPEPTYDFLITLDCLHDMTRPAEVIAAIKRGLKADGTWFIKDIRSKPKFEDNLRNPMLAMMYGFSLMSCMSSAMSEPGGAGLGTLGFNPAVAERMVREAGFTQFRMHDFKDPGNLYYEVRH